MNVTKGIRGILLGTLLAVAGCADAGTITAPDRSSPTAPAFDGIGTAGSGNRNDSTGVAPQSIGIGGAGSGNLDADSSTSEETGIGTAGSGN